jgi:hypothetical protein
MIYKNMFKKFGGEMTRYNRVLKKLLEKDPTATITIGCDSVQMRRKQPMQ